MLLTLILIADILGILSLVPPEKRWFLHEIHAKGKTNFSWNNNYKDCRCSYCYGPNKLHYGLNIPGLWKHWNSWWVIKYWNNRYIRWTNSWIKH